MVNRRPLWVSGRNYIVKHLAGCFQVHTGPSLFILANFGTRPEAAIARGPNSSRFWQFQSQIDENQFAIIVVFEIRIGCSGF